MSLLGFDTLGSLAVAQLPRYAATNTIFVAAQAALTLSGRSASFQSAFLPTTVGLTCVGVPAGVRLVLLGLQAGWLTSGTPVLYSLSATMSRGGLAVSGSSTASAGKMLAAGTSCGVSGRAAPLGAALVVRNASYQLVGAAVEFGRGLDNWFPLATMGSLWSKAPGPRQSWLPTQAADGHWLEEHPPEPTWDPAPVSPVGWKSI